MLNIKNPEADRLARALARATGETITEAVIQALRERLQRQQGRATAPNLTEDLLAISARCAALPDVDLRSPDEILEVSGFPRL